MLHAEKGAEQIDVENAVPFAELDLGALIELAARNVQAAPLAGYPAATQDVSLVVADSVAAAEVLDAVREGAGQLLESIRLVDDYRGSGIDAGQKSLTFALRFRASDRTLTAAEASEARVAGAAEARQ